MKIKILLFLILCSALLTCCKKEEPLTAKEERQQLITSAKEWTLQSLTIDGADKTSLYAGLTLHFTDTGFTAQNGLPIWPVSSSWSFTDETGTTITRDGDVQLSIIEITETKLVIRLQWQNSTFAPGRVRSLKGEHIFTFVK